MTETKKMNEAPSNHTGLNDTFSSQPAPQTNPFTADLKGEFTSNFGTNTNAVSQIFKEGGFVGNNRMKYMIIGGVALVVVAIVFFVLTGEESTDEFKDETAAEETTADDKEDEAAVTEETDEAEEATTEAEAAEPAVTETAATEAPVMQAAEPAATGPIALAEPADAASVNYDETQGPAVFSWTGGGGHIVFSRNSTMSPETLRIKVSGNSYKFHHPWPGTWYWKVQNGSGSSETRSFTVSPPARRNVQLAAPGGALSGNGGTVSWQGDVNIAFYRVEIANGSWANPLYRFATTGNSVQLNGVTAGQYQMRVGAFSEVSGRWEYTAPVPVSVQ
jgi:hypothetical protein